VPEPVRIFLSTVSDEFRAYLDLLSSDLTNDLVGAIVQEEFKAYGGATLEKLDAYVTPCDAVVHLVGDMTGAAAQVPSIKAILKKYPDLPQKFPPLGEALEKGDPISYTQWEAWLALYHDKVLLIAKAAAGVQRDPAYAPTDASRTAQQAHLARLAAVERYPEIEFTSPDNLAKQIANTTILDLLAEAPSPRKPNNLPFASLGPLFKGREGFLQTLHTALTRAGAGTAAAVTGKALHGLGGVGKTRLAIEYSLRHADDYSALLFVRAETPERLEAGLAALAGVDILDLKEKEAREDEVKIAAVLGWLARHPLWLMIFDNVDDRKAAAAVEKLLPKLFGGRVLITGRMANYSASVEMLPLDVLEIGDATEFLLDRTQGRRAGTPDDNAFAQDLAEKLGRLALALEQAGAYIATQRIGFARYLNLWQENRAQLLHWFDKDLMAYHHSLAATWATSVEQLTPAGRRLLERLAFFAPEPVPESLLDVACPSSFETGSSSPPQDEGTNPNGPHFEDGPHAEEPTEWASRSTRAAPLDFDAHEALADLFAYSLASRVAATDGRAREPGFAIHRLVQDFTRRGLQEAKRKQVLEEALRWVNAAFVGDPEDGRSWATLDPLAPHALALARRADEAGISEPTARLMRQLGSLFYAKCRYAEAEPMYRRAFAITEASFGPDHPNIAIDLNNLAQLLQATDRLAESEPMYRRALAIDEASFGPDHPNVARDLNNLAFLLQATNRLAEAEPMYRRALAIDEATYGPDHPDVARDLNNLSLLLKATNRLAEAEPMYRRALAIDEATYGPDHPDVANKLNYLASLLRATNRLAEAEPLMRRALAIFSRSFGWGHPSTTTAQENLSALLIAMGRSEAESRAAVEALAGAHGVKL